MNSKPSSSSPLTGATSRFSMCKNCWDTARISHDGLRGQRLAAFDQSLGRLQSQIANFVSFASEVVPFPFTDWPACD
jgi:hypothetical protein